MNEERPLIDVDITADTSAAKTAIAAIRTDIPIGRWPKGRWRPRRLFGDWTAEMATAFVWIIQPILDYLDKCRADRTPHTGHPSNPNEQENQ